MADMSELQAELDATWRDEVDRLILANGKLRAVAASGAALIRSLQATVEALTDPKYPVRISRREMMDLPPETRRRVMERCVDKFMARNGGQSDEASDTFDAGVQDDDATASWRTQDSGEVNGE